MHVANLVEVKGEITLESVQIYPGTSAMGFGPSAGMNMGYAPPPPPMQPSFGGDPTTAFGFPSAPPFAPSPPPFMVRFLDSFGFTE